MLAGRFQPNISLPHSGANFSPSDIRVQAAQLQVTEIMSSQGIGNKKEESPWLNQTSDDASELSD